MSETDDDTGPAQSKLTPEQNKAAVEYLTALVKCLEGEDRICPQCKREITGAEKIGRCVYGIPCGCRMWQGNVPKWARPEKRARTRKKDGN